jgi:hypothetical protein
MGPYGRSSQNELLVTEYHTVGQIGETTWKLGYGQHFCGREMVLQKWGQLCKGQVFPMSDVGWSIFPVIWHFSPFLFII